MPTGLGWRESLRKENEKLKNANSEWRTEARREKLRNDTTIDNWGQLQEEEDKLKQFLPVICRPTVRLEAIDPACLLLRDKRLAQPRWGNHRDLLFYQPLLANLPI